MCYSHTPVFYNMFAADCVDCIHLEKPKAKKERQRERECYFPTCLYSVTFTDE